MDREAIGIIGFDILIQGGLLPGRVYILAGPPGCGKTTFATQFLANGAKHGQCGVFITMNESADTIIHDMSNYNIGISGFMKLNKLHFIDLGPSREYGFFERPENNRPGSYEAEAKTPSPRFVYEKIKELIEEYDIKRIVIDSVSSIRFSTDDLVAQEKSVSRFIRNLKNLGCTTILISEMTNPSSYTIEHFAAHGLIFLHNFFDSGKNSMTRAIQIIKMRGTRHDCDMRSIEFTHDGLIVKGKLS